MRPCAVVVLAGIVLAQAPQFTIPPGKHLPFASIAPAVDPLSMCDGDGVSATHTPSDQKKRENAAKNNLWVGGAATPIEFKDFTTLQQAVGNAPDLTASRTIVETPRKVTHGHAGEGTVVQLVARIADAHVADCTADQPDKPGEHGEAVNCDFIGVEANDLHVTLMPRNEPNGNRCDSVTAEIIPHFRPLAWQTLDQKTPAANVVRVTGTLFFDDSHLPCDPKTKQPAPGGNPARRSVWEIHPVYAIDVCTASTPTHCTAANAAAWMPYDRWVVSAAAQPVVTDEGGARASCNVLANNQPVAPPIPPADHTRRSGRR